MEEQDYATTFVLESHNWWFVGMRRISLALLGRRAGDPPVDQGLVLDVGCGTGIMLEELADVGSAIGLDSSRTALDFSRRRESVRLVQGRGEALPFADSTFEVVTAFGVIEHIGADRAALDEWARVLRPGGRVVLLTSAYQWLWSGHDVSNHHVRRYKSGEVRNLMRGAGLESIRVSYVNCLLFPPILLVRLVERLLRGGRPPVARKDTGEVPRLANDALIWLLDLERRAVLRRGLPFGVSIVASAVKSG